MREDHWAVGHDIELADGTTATVAAVDATAAPSRVQTAGGDVVDGTAIEAIAWGGADA